MTSHPELLAALIAERFPAAAIEAERFPSPAEIIAARRAELRDIPADEHPAPERLAS